LYSSFAVDILHDIAVSSDLLLFWCFSYPLTLSSVAFGGEEEDETGEEEEGEDEDEDEEEGEEERAIGGVGDDEGDEEGDELWTDIEGPRATGTEERALVKKIIWLYSSESEKGVLRSEGSCEPS